MAPTTNLPLIAPGPGSAAAARQFVTPPKRSGQGHGVQLDQPTGPLARTPLLNHTCTTTLPGLPGHPASIVSTVRPDRRKSALADVGGTRLSSPTTCSMSCNRGYLKQPYHCLYHQPIFCSLLLVLLPFCHRPYCVRPVDDLIHTRWDDVDPGDAAPPLRSLDGLFPTTHFPRCIFSPPVTRCLRYS